MMELWGEIMASIAHNKLRTVLTGFSVAWGIFMLVVLLGAGRGLENGVMSSMASRTLNVISVESWRTSMAYKGYQKDRYIKLDHSDVRFIDATIPNAHDVSGRYQKNTQASSGKNFLPAVVEGVSSVYQGVNGTEMLRGRFPAMQDIREQRKVIAVEKDVAEILYPKQDAIGRQAMIDGVSYTIVGITKPRRWGGALYIYMPLSTMESVYASSFDEYESLSFLANDLKTKEQNENFNKDLEQALKAKHTIDPKDTEGIYINNRYEQYTQNKGVMDGVTIFIWMIGLSTLLAGIVGVSNIMLVTVRERMNEIGIRKAIGASPRSILVMILAESLLITLFFGYLGLIAGMGLMEGINSLLKNGMGQGPISNIFTNPTIDISVAVSATLVLVLAGLVAGFLPALKAVMMKTIDALRQQK